jgi:hypothetical protein
MKKDWPTFILLLITLCFSCNFINDVKPGFIDFQKINCPYQGIIQDFCIANNNDWYLIGDFNLYGNRKSVWAKTTDGGTSWNVDTINLKDEWVQRINTFNNKLYIYTWPQNEGHPRIYYSENWGSDWILMDSAHCYGSPLYFIDDNTMLYNYCGIIDKTYDRGRSWTRKIPVDSIYGEINLYYFDKVTGYAFGLQLYDPYGSVLFKTTDSGETWNKMTGDFPFQIHETYFLNSQTGYSFTTLWDNYKYNFNLYKTTNGGNQWLLINKNLPEDYPKSYFLNEEQGIIYSEKAIYSTNDGGHSYNKEISERNISMNKHFELLNPRTMIVPYTLNDTSGFLMKLTLKF